MICCCSLIMVEAIKGFFAGISEEVTQLVIRAIMETCEYISSGTFFEICIR